ncbi:MAG: prephenate dehydrogenase/arogenate dehydrogenase family protein [bacterium]
MENPDSQELSPAAGTPLFQRVAIVGVGLIGGSLARAAKQKGLIGTVVGLGRGKENLLKALELGVIDVLELDWARGLRDADLIVLATPVCSLPELLAKTASCRDPQSTVTDVGSVKLPIVQQAEAVFSVPSPFVGGHPIAGTEHSGVEASFATLFERRSCILTPSERTDPAALRSVRRLWEAVGSEVVIMDPERHDRIMGFVSHLPHMVAYALVDAVRTADEQGGDISAYSAGGFRDFTRIASSHPEMWRDICLMNGDAILEAMDAFDKSIGQIRRLVKRRDGEGLRRLFLRSRRTRAKFLENNSCDRAPRKGQS